MEETIQINTAPIGYFGGRTEIFSLAPKVYFEATSLYPEMIGKIKAKGIVEDIFVDDETFKGKVYCRNFINSFYGRWGIRKTPKCKL